MRTFTVDQQRKYNSQQIYADSNKNVLSFFLKSAVVVAHFMSFCNLFHAVGAATWNALSPSLSLVQGTSRFLVCAERNDARPGRSDTNVNLSRR